MNENIEEKIETTEEEALVPVPEEKTLPEVVGLIREEYETKIAELESKHAADLKERDEIITQFISGKPNDSNASRPSFVERLNNKRKYKKW